MSDWFEKIGKMVEIPVPRHGMEDAIESKLGSDVFSGNKPDPFGGARPRETVLEERIKNLRIGPSNETRSGPSNQTRSGPLNQTRNARNQQYMDPQTWKTKRTKAMKAERLEIEINMMKEELKNEEELGSNPGDLRDVLKELIKEKEAKLRELTS